MRGKWAQGIEPRHFRWIIKDRFAVCERPGGYGENHRRVRRQEEIIWLRQNDFDRVISLIPSTHNLHNYAELEMPFRHVPYAGPHDGPEALVTVLATIRDHVAAERIIVHRDELGERIAGVVAAYLLWMELVPAGPEAITITEQLLERELGPMAREIVSMIDKIPASADVEAGSMSVVSDPEAELVAVADDAAEIDLAVDESPASS